MSYRFYYILAILALLTACESDQEPTKFTRLNPDQTGLDFVNATGENDSFNILTNEYIYNGGGVGIGDFDADGRPDIFLSGNQGPNALYLNRGDWKFENVTLTSEVAGEAQWSGGVTVVDVNGDGLDDIYVCASVRLDKRRRTNQLYLNQGNNADGIPVFKNVAAEMGLDLTGHNTQAAWLDFDLDGDLDVFLLVNKMVDSRVPNTFTNKITDGSGERTDKLYRQDQDEDGNITFTEVGKEHGILYQGFGLGVSVCDLNRDGRPDLYVSNDYLSNDLVYLNTVNEDGRAYFVDVAADVLKHSSFSAMGNDVADLNNDGLPDILVVDMLPADNMRRKMMMPANNYTNFINNERFGYYAQYGRNTLQLSQGLRPDESDIPLYAEVAMSAGLPATDWSWTPLVADFDLDGYRDVIITNGFPRDITDHDFGDYRVETSRFQNIEEMLPQIPSVKLKNEAFRATLATDGFPTYEKVTADWGIDVTSFSNGAAYADFDGDGDLDYVVNNIDDPAHLYRNDHINNDPETTVNYLKLQPANGLASKDWFGAAVKVSTENGEEQFAYWHPHRGYLSSHGKDLIFGFAEQSPQSTNVLVRWPNGETRRYGPFAPGETVELSPAAGVLEAEKPAKEVVPLLASESVLEFIHQERDYIDFNAQPMLLRKLSEQGPYLAASDLDGDGYDDLYVSGSYDRDAYFISGKSLVDYRSSKDSFMPGRDRIPFSLPFRKSIVEENDPENLPPGFQPAVDYIEAYNNQWEELGSLFFDADGDGDDDLYVVSGSYEFKLDEGDYQDRFYRNESGRFVRDEAAIAELPAFSGSVVRAADYDGDGDQDLFVGGRVVPQAYPTPQPSYLLRNESQNGQIRFVLDRSNNEVVQSAENVTDALFTDFNNDGQPDLMLAGEWGPLRLYKNIGGSFTEVTDKMGLNDQTGWYSSLVAGDFDGDGDLDYVAGNYGTNTLFQPDADHPLQAYLVDLDLNGTMDLIPSTWFEDEDGEMRRFPYFNRSDFAKQLTGVKARHKRHVAYARATADTYELTEEQARENPHYFFRANNFKHQYLENREGQFVPHELPATAQSFPIFSMQTVDINADGHLDLVAVGNDWGNEVGQGAMDAGNGLVLLGDGTGQFSPLSTQQSGLYVPGQARSLISLNTPDGPIMVAGQNRGPLVVIQPVDQ